MHVEGTYIKNSLLNSINKNIFLIAILVNGGYNIDIFKKNKFSIQHNILYILYCSQYKADIFHHALKLVILVNLRTFKYTKYT